MTEFVRLEEKLTKLQRKTAATGGPRVLRAGDVEGLLSAVVTEIDETILPRCLGFSVGDGAPLALAISHRRCQAVMAPMPSLAGTNLSALEGVALDSESDLIATLKMAFVSLIGSSGELKVTTARLPTASYSADTGVTAQNLASAWGLGEVYTAPRTAEEVMTDFLATLGEGGHVWLHIVGENVVKGSGSAEDKAALSDVAALFLDGYFAKFENIYPTESGAVFTALAANGGSAVLFAETEDQSVFAQVAFSALPELAATWSRLTS